MSGSFDRVAWTTFDSTFIRDERRERKSDCEISEVEKKTRMGSLKKRALNASSKFRHSLKKRSKKKDPDRLSSLSIKDVRDDKELQAVESFRQALLLEDLLPARHDDSYKVAGKTIGINGHSEDDTSIPVIDKVVTECKVTHVDSIPTVLRRVGDLEDKVHVLYTKPVQMPVDKDELLQVGVSPVDALESELITMKRLCTNL